MTEASDELVETIRGLLPQLTEARTPPTLAQLRETVEGQTLLVARDDGGRILGMLTLVLYRVHDRLDEPCPNCRTPLAQIDFEEHTIYYCPHCQTDDRVLKDRRMSRLLR